MKKRIVLSAILVITLSFCLLTGATFALFTSESEVNIAVTSGKVNVVAEIKDIELYSMDNKQDGSVFENGGTASYDSDTGKLTLVNATPGDKVKFNIVVTNNSNITIQYRVNWTVDGVLSEALVAKADEKELVNGSSDWTKWDIPVNESETKVISVEVELPIEAGNEYQEKTADIKFLVEAVQGNAKMPVSVTSANISSTNFEQENTDFLLIGEFDEISIAKLGEGSTLSFDNVTSSKVTLNGKNTIIGDNKLSCALLVKGTAEVPAELIIKDATLDLGNNELKSEQTVDKTTAGTAKLVIENSTVKCGNIFVGGHSMNQPIVTAELSIKNSYVSCEENGLGSTIAVWGQDNVKAEILDSEIHTYSRGWHQSEDANDNSITFQGGGKIDVNIERTNMHLYGARSIINARKYSSENAVVDFSIDESLIWVVTKSNHGEETIPVWGSTSITNTVLVFAKNVHQSTPAVVKSWVYGNPTIYGEYAVTTQCGWETTINVADGQTITLSADAKLSIYEDAADVNFVLTGSAKVVLEEGATLTNIGVVAADGYTLNTVTENGKVIYSVTAN